MVEGFLLIIPFPQSETGNSATSHRVHSDRLLICAVFLLRVPHRSHSGSEGCCAEDFQKVSNRVHNPRKDSRERLASGATSAIGAALIRAAVRPLDPLGPRATPEFLRHIKQCQL